MQLGKKRLLAARTLNVGAERIQFNKERLEEVKEAITKQDIRDLNNTKVINIKQPLGTKSKGKKKTRRRFGSKKRNVNTRKRDYMTITRKLRRLCVSLKSNNKITNEQYYQLRKEIRTKAFRSKAQFKERLNQIKSERKK